MFVIKNDDSSQDTLEELVWISGIQGFTIMASDKLFEVPTKHYTIPSEYFATISVLTQSNIQYCEFVFSWKKFHQWQEYILHSIPFV
jgi:hypothetical protein